MIAEMLTCIALNVYYEARSEPLEGQYAVAHVVLNRVASPRFPDDACSVVYQGLEKGIGRCQFSWYCDGKSDTPKEKDAWLYSQLVAHHVVRGYVKDNTDGSIYYHANYVRPFWSKHYDHTVTLGSHIFYK